MNPMQENRLLMTRRYFFGLNAAGLGAGPRGEEVRLSARATIVSAGWREGIEAVPAFVQGVSSPRP